MSAFFFPPQQIRYYFAENRQTSRLIIKKYNFFLPLYFLNARFSCVNTLLFRKISAKFMIFWSKWVVFSVRFGLETLHSRFGAMKLKIGTSVKKRKLRVGAEKAKITLLYQLVAHFFVWRRLMQLAQMCDPWNEQYIDWYSN